MSGLPALYCARVTSLRLYPLRLIVLMAAAALAACSAVAYPSAPCGGPGSPASADVVSPFGVGPSFVNARSSADLARWIPAMKAIGVDVLRTPDIYWHDVEQRPGQWNWRAVDDQVDYLVRQNVSFGVLLYGNPGWNAQDERGTLPVNNLAGWTRYVTQVATRLRGKVECFQVWNEPPNNTGRAQTPADYARLVRATYEAVKAVDPRMKVGLGAKSVHLNYLELVIRAGARDAFDYITLHPYEVLDHVAESSSPNAEAVYLNIVPAARRMLAAASPERKDVPIVFTELGISAAKGQRVQASGLLKAYTMGIAQGVAQIQWFEGLDGDSGPLGLIDGAGKPRMAYRALGSLIEYLGRVPRYRGWLLLNGRHPAFVFDGPRGPVAVAWTAMPATGDPLSLSEMVTVIDPSTGKSVATRTPVLDRDPRLLLNLPSALLSEAAANLLRPFRGEADFADSQELFIEYDTGRTSGGLYTVAESAVAESVRAYGGNARAGNVPGGHMFVVHPSFLGNSSVPLEVTVEVRRLSPAVSAGFNLKYEALSPDAFANAGWFTIPQGTGWARKTWRIDNPRFVWFWGYNFALDADGVHHQYAIRSVRVRKVGVASQRP